MLLYKYSSSTTLAEMAVFALLDPFRVTHVYYTIFKLHYFDFKFYLQTFFCCNFLFHSMYAEIWNGAFHYVCRTFGRVVRLITPGLVPLIWGYPTVPELIALGTLSVEIRVLVMFHFGAVYHEDCRDAHYISKIKSYFMRFI